MGKFKVNSIEDNKNFLITDCYKKLCKMFETLKVSKGKIVHVVGAPGTGKSANIYSALNKMDLNVYAHPTQIFAQLHKIIYSMKPRKNKHMIK